MTKIKCLTGEEWYSQQASRAVNQAVGRVIRHRHDYGAIIFCDERFTYSNRQSQISLWIQPHVKCYSKFGDVVYTLTRFFRNGGTRGPSKLELTRNEDQETVRVLESSKLLDKFNPENVVVTQTATTDPKCSLGVSTSSKQVKQGNVSVKLREVVPANRSTLTSDNLFRDSTVISLSDLRHPKKSSWISGKKSMEDLDGEIGELIAPCSLKKRRLLMTGPDNSKHYEKFDHHLNNLVKRENLKCSDKVSMQNPQENREVITCHETITQEQNVDLINQNHSHKDFVSQTPPHNDQEKKGSAFLFQVREKLSDAEYKEFVGFMKALKSKAMKIGHVLESITRLFSLPDRLSLLHGFKEYVPAKYHSLYEQYLCTNRNAAGV